MPQLSLYLDEPTMMLLRKSASGAGVSMSKYASSLIREKSHGNGWPLGYWENIYGCLEEQLAVDDAELDATRDDDCDWFE